MQSSPTGSANDLPPTVPQGTRGPIGPRDASPADPGMTADSLRSQAQQTAQNLRQQTTNQANSQLDMAAQSAQQTSQALHRVSGELRNNQQTMLADYADRGAEQIGRLSHYLSENDIRAVLDDVQDYARRQPLIFVAGALGIGIIASRFFKSSSRFTGGTPYAHAER